MYDSLARIFSDVPIAYVKWDMNRGLTEIGSAAASPDRQQEIAHRYVPGLYDLLERLTSAFPQILFESCSSGGGRFDPGMLYYMPQTWTSDNTDALEPAKNPVRLQPDLSGKHDRRSCVRGAESSSRQRDAAQNARRRWRCPATSATSLT
ncbi:alpha-galactosidase [Paenibacillus harenae]|uniref:Alpha-galactosidase n=1 Tax=Paenibacillus harenae TaxID=306543 RepID=A0ABT9UA62_PAEHA|nr:alpha-galactosidase [Paenibacillus harenae]